MLTCVLLLSCNKDKTFIDEHIIPAPKIIQLQDDRMHPIKDIIVSGSTQNLQYLHNKDEYFLKIEKGNVYIEGNEIWARQTLTQLADNEGYVPDIQIHDWSEYPFRGFMHDTGRNFQTIEMLKETIDLMSFYKINYFHWHLTDYPAWRIECKVYPQLNDPQYQRPGRDCGKYYTYDEIRDLIAYAKERGITIMPEIDMPGHSAYFKNAFGFTMDSEDGLALLPAVCARAAIVYFTPFASLALGVSSRYFS